MKNATLFALISACVLSLALGCGKDEPNPVSPDAFPPGHEWGGGDWPSLKSPDFGNNVIMGDPVPSVTVPFKGTFTPTLTAVMSNQWHIKITRDEALCTAWNTWDLVNTYWSYALPKTTYHFNFSWDCFVSNSTLTDYDVSWPLTDTHKFELMRNGQWELTQSVPRETRPVGGNDYDLDRSFTLFSQPPLHLCMARCWVQGAGSDGDRIFPEGPITIKITTKSGVKKTNTTSFASTTSLGASYTIEGLCLSLNQSFQNSSSYTVTFSEEKEVSEERPYTIPANEQWRYIQLYGVERYMFTDASGATWTTSSMICNALGNVDNAVRNVLMIVKYKAGSTKPYASEYVDLVGVE